MQLLGIPTNVCYEKFETHLLLCHEFFVTDISRYAKQLHLAISDEGRWVGQRGSDEDLTSDLSFLDLNASCDCENIFFFLSTSKELMYN